MSIRKTIYSLLIILAVLAETNIVEAITLSNSNVCPKEERNALLTFKEGLNDSSNSLYSWVGEDCCTNWFGVSCSNQTGHVSKLDLYSQFFCSTEVEEGNKTTFLCKYLHLGGKLSHSLLQLKYLAYLDLSGNDFQGIPIPDFLGSLTNLRYLDLSDSNFSGMIPPNLGNLSKLLHLGLASDHFLLTDTLWVSNLHWLPNLSSLEYLNLEGVNLSKAAPYWLPAVNMLPSLLELRLPSCDLRYFPPSFPSMNFTSLSVLDISYNLFNSFSIPQWWFNITTLVNLKVSSSNLRGPIPKAVGGLCNLQTLDLSSNYYISGEIEDLVNDLSRCSNVSLEYLDLSSNKLGGNLPNSLGFLKHLKYLKLKSNLFSGQIPASIGNLPNLLELHLSYNLLSGPIPSSIGNLSNLQTLDLKNNIMDGAITGSIGQLANLMVLDLFWNPWEGVITELHFQNLTNLVWLSLSSTKNSLVFKVPRDWIPPFNLTTLWISGCQLGPSFPSWLQTQTKLSDLTLSSAAILGTLSDCLSNISLKIDELDLSHNKLEGKLPDSSYFGSLWFIDLSYNRFEGSVPLWTNVTYLYLSNNLLSGAIPSGIGYKMPTLKSLDLSDNFLNGSIPPSANRLKSLKFLYLSNNQLSGEIQNHLGGLENLYQIDLSGNKLSGRVPSSLCSLPSLNWLQVSNNNLSGELSLSLHDCRHVSTLDLGENRFSGTIPEWIGKRLFSLAELRLRSNLLSGNIPEELCQLTFLHVLDLAHNNLSGSIPSCLGRLVGFQNSGLYIKFPPSEHQPPSMHMDLVLKGRQDEYAEQLGIVNTIDLSVNSLSGEIPVGITNLSKLVTLNLSMNQLTGNIPEMIGDLKRLETLDLSWNRLEGHIPQSMSSVTFLNHLNLSYNNLSGPIPFTSQLNTFNDASIYEGNAGLCGPPLPAMCSDGIAESKEGTHGDDEDAADKFWFYVSMGLGFIVGFWAVCGSLVINKSWRHSYFRYLDHVKDRLFLIIAIHVARLQRNMEV